MRKFSLLLFILIAGNLLAEQPGLLFKLAVSPSSLFLVPSHTFKLHALRTFFKGDSSAQFQEDVTSNASWSTLDSSIANVDSSGLVTADPANTGPVTIQALLGPLVATTQLTVSNTVTLNSIGLSPRAQSLIFAPSQTVTYSATGSFSDSSTQDLTSTATWKSSVPSVAAMAGNVANIAGIGDTAITASSGSVSSAATNLNIVPILAVTPLSAAMVFGQTQQFSANLAVVWSVDGVRGGNLTVGTISPDGLYTSTAASVGAPHTIAATTVVAPAQKASATAQVVSGFKGVFTYHNDNMRSGLDPNEVLLNPSNVNVSHFKKLFVLPADGKVDAQPLYVPNFSIPSNGTRNVLLVVTEHDSVYLYDADTGSLYWRQSMLGPGETTSDDRGCGQVSPEMGITDTPVIDLSRGPHGTIYLVAMSKNGGTYFQRIHALDLATGVEEFGGPKVIQAKFPGKGENSNGADVIFDPAQYKERDGLLALNGKIYLAWASHCDIEPYTGWIMAYDEGTLAQTSVLNITPNGSEGAFWNSGGGLAADSNGLIYQTAGNGTFDTKLNPQGFPSSGDFGNAFLKFSTSPSLAVADYFAMFNTVSESNSDADLGSGGALLLPDLTDSHGQTRHLALGGGKDGNLYIVDRDHMGKFVPGSVSNSYVYQELFSVGKIFSTPAYFNGEVYVGAVGSPLLAYKFNQAVLGTAAVSATAKSFPYPGATPSISSAGTLNGIVWAAQNSNPAVLHAYDATNLGKELYNSSQAPGGRDNFGIGNKFIAPTVANGHVYVGTTNGVGVFGLF